MTVLSYHDLCNLKIHLLGILNQKHIFCRCLQHWIEGKNNCCNYTVRKARKLFVLNGVCIYSPPYLHHKYSSLKGGYRVSVQVLMARNFSGQKVSMKCVWPVNCLIFTCKPWVLVWLIKCWRYVLCEVSRVRLLWCPYPCPSSNTIK